MKQRGMSRWKKNKPWAKGIVIVTGLLAAIVGLLATAWCIYSASESRSIVVLNALLVWVTAIYACLTYRIVTAQRASLQAQILTKLLDDYFSQTMLNNMLLLKEFQRKHREGFDRAFGLSRVRSYDLVKDVDIARRCFKSYFYELFFLLETKVVTSSFVKKLVTPGAIAFLLEVIEPLEKATNKNYEKDRFQFFRDLYKEELAEGKGKFELPEWISRD